ncbi:MAG: hypothetical protein ACFB4J_20270 [Elainellaceae cyanobacterium]
MAVEQTKLGSVPHGRADQGVISSAASSKATVLSIIASIITGLINVAPAVAADITVGAGNIRAEYRDEAGDLCIESPQITISRDGAIAFDESITSELGICRRADRFEVQDLDQDGEPEVLIDFYSGGAHCCWFSQIYRYRADQNDYVVQEHYWGNSGSPQVSDLEGDGQPEFVSYDDRFAYQFAAYANSGLPLQIWRYDDGAFLDVTRQYPERVYDSAYQLWQQYQSARNRGSEVKGYLAAYLATKHLLDQGEDGWQRVQTVYRGGDRPQFFSELSTFLQQTGYTAAASAPGAQSVAARASAGDSAVLLQQDGSLDPGDGILPTDGSLYDEHLFTATAGDVVLIRLESDAFDPYLFLVGPEGELIAQNDDASETDLSAALVLTLPQSGAYRAIANSYDSTGRGAYQLTVRRQKMGSSPTNESAPEEPLD